MTEQDLRAMESFWTMLRNDPKNDANRHVFADWCEEHGEDELAADLRWRSAKWLRDFAELWKPYEDPNVAYENLIIDAMEGHFSSHGRDMYGKGRINSEIGLDVMEQFWHHVRVMTGINIDENYRENFVWSCSC